MGKQSLFDKFFKKKTRILPLPPGCTADMIRIETSTCTGEQTIGFYDSAKKQLIYAELITNPCSIVNFYEKYGLKIDK